jgi:hypothetical protein
MPRFADIRAAGVAHLPPKGRLQSAEDRLYFFPSSGWGCILGEQIDPEAF